MQVMQKLINWMAMTICDRLCQTRFPANEIELLEPPSSLTTDPQFLVTAPLFSQAN